MATLKPAASVLVAATLLSGCFGYNKSAKRWAYVGDTVLVLGGGGVIAGDVLTRDSGPCMPVTPNTPCAYEAPLTGAIVAGAVLAAAGVFGYVFNATRPNVKTSR
ncbi:MAG TPA: hypothetical protein VM513_36545 [Kofleriaceae bacterium]|jgi:hypothetical protein|nr:hypothetical protein [Kofleriaceae bacterium]